MNRIDYSSEQSHSSESKTLVDRVVAVAGIGREAVSNAFKSAGEVIKFAANTFSAIGEQRNAFRYGTDDKATSPRGVDRMLYNAHHSQTAEARRANREQKRSDRLTGFDKMGLTTGAMAAVAIAELLGIEG